MELWAVCGKQFPLILKEVIGVVNKDSIIPYVLIIVISITALAVWIIKWFYLQAFWV